ncbi:MAG: DUF423 domain-containing protein [Sphingomonadaceae bacterium]
MKRDALVVAAALSAALAVAAGAFGAHGAEAQAAAWLKTGTAYQLPHAAAAITVSRFDRRVSWLLLAGGAIFGCTLYAMALGAPRWLGAVTPLGGAMMIAGWLWLALGRRI